MESFKPLSAKSTTDLFESIRRERGLLGPFVQLTKPRLSMMSVASAVFGYFSAAPQERNTLLFLSLLAGTALAAAGAAALNQWMEIKEDALMRRTADRPLPAGDVKPMHALLVGLLTSVAGLTILALGTNLPAMLLTLGVLFFYLALYTPMKKSTPLATEAGAVSGALPPLLGYVAATGSVLAGSFYGWLLFAILFAWQMPHFMAISWMHREDYRQAGFRMLAHEDRGAARVGRKSLLYTLLLVALTFVPAFKAGSGTSTWYLCLNGLLSAYLLYQAVRFLHPENKEAHARSLFYATILHLPVFMILFALDRYI